MILHRFEPQDSPGDTVGDLEAGHAAGRSFGSLPCSFVRQMDVRQCLEGGEYSSTVSHSKCQWNENHWGFNHHFTVFMVYSKVTGFKGYLFLLRFYFSFPSLELFQGKQSLSSIVLFCSVRAYHLVSDFKAQKSTMSYPFTEFLLSIIIVFQVLPCLGVLLISSEVDPCAHVTQDRQID